MKKTLFILTVLLSLVACGKEKDCPACRPDEICEEGGCNPQPGKFYLGGKTIISSNLYWGVVGGAICADTILLSVKADTVSPEDRFSLFVKFPPILGGLRNIRPILVSWSEEEGYRLGALRDPDFRFCHQDGNNYYVSAWCKVNEGTVDMKLHFLLGEGFTPELVDSTTLTLYRR